MLENLGDSLKQQLDKAKDAMDTVSGMASELKDAGMDKIKSYLDEIMSGLPLIEQAGFEVNGINIDMGIPPDIAIDFSKNNEVSEEAIKALIEENQEKKLLGMILKALLTTNKLQSNITLNKFVFAGVSIKLGIPPQVSLKYR